jgi:hypothetical protein
VTVCQHGDRAVDRRFSGTSERRQLHVIWIGSLEDLHERRKLYPKETNGTIANVTG